MKIIDIPQSGSRHNITASRNRYGQYYRVRAIPVQPRTNYQTTQRVRMADNAIAWRSLTDNQRAGWASLGLSITRTDSLGQTYNLTGLQAYCMVNNNLLDAGEAVISAAPAIVAPGDLLTAVVTTAGGTLSLAYTTTPLAASTRLFVYASPQRSAGRNYEGDFRLIFVTAAAAASPANILASYSARFGAPVVDNKIFFSCQLHKGGFLGGVKGTSVVVTA
jgi:hypothetical protein